MVFGLSIQYKKEERFFMVKCYIETKSPDDVIEAFRNRFPNRNVPSKSTIYRKIENFSNEGISLNLNKEGRVEEDLPEHKKTSTVFDKRLKKTLT